MTEEEEKEVPMVSSWEKRGAVEDEEKENPNMMGISDFQREFDVATAGVATAGIAATTFVPHYVDKRFALNWWQDLLVSAGVAVGGTVAVDSFMSRHYSRVFFWAATGTVIVKGIRELLEKQGLYGLGSGYQAGEYEREQYGFSDVGQDEFDFGLDEFDEGAFEGVGFSEGGQAGRSIPQPDTDEIRPTTMGDASTVEFGV